MEEKAVMQMNTSTSPKSPFQFGLMKSLFRTSSYSASSCSLDNDSYDEDRFILGPIPAPAAAAAAAAARPGPPVFLDFRLEDVEGGQWHLRSAMRKAMELQVAIHESHSRVQGMVNRVCLLGIAVSPLASQASKARRLKNHIDGATRPAKTALRVFHAMQKLHGTLSVGPLQDVGRYMEAISQFQQHVKVMEHCGPSVIQALAEGLPFLKGSRMVDRFHMEELYQVIETLKALMASREHLALSADLVKQALKHLKAAFQRILKDYVKPLDLHLSRSGSFRGLNLTKQKQALPSPVLQLLQGISEVFAHNDKFDDFLEAYQADRGLKLGKSLGTLDSSCYLCCQAPDAIDDVEWAILEGHLAKWVRHLDVFVRILLASEYNLYKQVISETSVEASHWKDGFGRMATQVGLDSFIGFGDAFTKSHMEPQKLFKLLDMFDCLERLKPHFKEMFYEGGIECKEIYRRIRSLYRGVVEGVARVLKELIYKVEEEENKETWERSSDVVSKGGTVLKLVSYIVNYLKCMLSEWYKPLVGRALKAEHSLNKARYNKETQYHVEDEGEEQERLLHEVVLEVMQALDRNLATTAQRLAGVPAYASFFLMNNYSYIYSRCLKSDVEVLLGHDWLQQQLDKMELCAMQYKQEAWGHLILLINCDGISSSLSTILSSGSSAACDFIRQRAKAFQVSLDMVVACHATWFIPNETLRKRISHDVLHSVLPAYRSFLEKYVHLLLSSANAHPQISPGTTLTTGIPSSLLDAAVVRYTPERVESMLTSLFEMQLPPHHLHMASASNIYHAHTSSNFTDDPSDTSFKSWRAKLHNNPTMAPH